MFIVRAELFKPLQHQYTLADFQVTDGKVSDSTFAHVMKRLFGAVVEAQSFAIKGFATSRRFLCHAVCQNILTFFYQKEITNNNKLLIKICKIPVFQKKYLKFLSKKMNRSSAHIVITDVRRLK